MRLRPGQHLRRQSDIRNVRQNGRRVDCSSFTVWWMPKLADVACRRACFVASTQAVGKAVERNRAKRRLREVFRRHQELLPSSVDVMFVARSRVNERPLAELDRAFTDACGRMQRSPSP